MTNPNDLEDLEDLKVGDRVMMMKPKASAYDPLKGSMGTYKGRNGSSYMVKWDAQEVIWAVVRDQIRKISNGKEGA